MWRIRFWSFAVLFVLFALMHQRSWGFRQLATYFPVFVSTLGAIVGLVAMVRVWRGDRVLENQSEIVASGELGQARTAEEIAGAGMHVIWLSAYVVLVILIGLVPASPIFVALFMKRYADVGWIWSIVSGAGVTGLLFAFRAFLEVSYPMGVLL